MTVRSTTLPQATSPSISDVLAGTGLPTFSQEVTLVPAQDTSQASTPEVTETFVLATLGPDVNVQVTLSSSQQTFMRVIVDGKVQFDGRTDAGHGLSVSGEGPNRNISWECGRAKGHV